MTWNLPLARAKLKGKKKGPSGESLVGLGKKIMNCLRFSPLWQGGGADLQTRQRQQDSAGWLFWYIRSNILSGLSSPSLLSFQSLFASTNINLPFQMSISESVTPCQHWPFSASGCQDQGRRRNSSHYTPAIRLWVKCMLDVSNVILVNIHNPMQKSILLTLL